MSTNLFGSLVKAARGLISARSLPRTQRPVILGTGLPEALRLVGPRCNEEFILHVAKSIEEREAAKV
ncbi:hypothetical protein OE766_14685 [Pararhizobium sp. YC-54]|uniref:hypothetical protein n=1 Tax=Pararhizobium sp. YC-54 TaxID=2986920 RepID=UPI0021F70EA3|nr:hypothetical protein [Pararhizobium sp. YC-54]MCV9999489.1 hypothetical protein [Pararhizobium sp. YC-54]